MKLLKVLTIAFCMIFAPLSFSQSGGAGGSSAAGSAGSADEFQTDDFAWGVLSELALGGPTQEGDP